MALLKFKRSAVPAKIPSIADLDLGELAINTYDGKVYTKKDDGTEAIVEVGGGGGVQTIASADGSVTVTGTTDIDLSVAVAAATTTIILPVRNNTGATLAKGTAVYINGALGQNPTVTKAIATSDATSAQTLGLVSIDLPNNTVGNVTLIGSLDDVDTSAYTDGAQLYLSPTTAGALTATKPYAPNHLVYIAVVEYAHPTHGKLFVKVQNGYEMDELHDVSAQNPANNDGLFYNTTSGLWEKKSIVTALGYTPANRAGDTFTGVVSIYNSNDAQLYLNGNGTSWAGMSWADVSGSDYIWYNGSTSTFAIGSGGSFVANKKLHVHGGMTIGSGLAMSASGTNSLLVEETITANQVYAQIFYDSQNGAYYVDPAASSNLYSATVNSVLVLPAAAGTNSFFVGTGDGASLSTYNFGLSGWNGMAFYNPTVGGAFPNATTGFLAFRDGFIEMRGSLRAPVFYDSDNTGYYVDAAGTSVLGGIVVNSTLDVRDSNAQFWRSTNGAYQRVDTRTEATSLSRAHWYGVNSSGGTSNFRHAWYDNAAYFNVTAQDGEIIFERTAGETIVRSTGSFRAPIFYDSDNTAWYVNAAGDSFLSSIYTDTVNSAVVGDPLELCYARGNEVRIGPSGGNLPIIAGEYTRPAAGVGFLSGRYGGVETNGTTGPIYCISTSYAPTSTTLGSMYGIGFTDGASSGVWGGGGWGMYVAAAGVARVFLDGNSGIAYATGSMRTPIFYDSNDTAFYIDPNSTSRLSVANVNFLTLLNDEGLNVKGIRGQFAAGSDGQGISLFSNVDIGYPSGWGSGLGNTPSRGLSVYGGLRVAYSGGGFITSDTSVRSPIFYDSNDTNYYINPNASSAVKGEIVIGPNNSYTQFIRLGGEGQASDMATVCTTNGNLHMDSKTGFHIYANYASNGNIYLNNGGGFTEGITSIRAPIFYDSNDTGYYIDAASNSVLNTLTLGGRATTSVMYYQGFTLDANTMDTNATGFTYGVNAPFVGPIIRAGESGYSLQLNAPYGGGGRFAFRTRNGDTGSFNSWQYPALYDQNVNGGGALYASIYYDQNNTVYYLNPESTSVLWEAATYYLRNIEDVAVNHEYGLYFSNSRSTAYAIYREAGAWTHPYPDLRIAFHTGIKMGAAAGYGGMKFYTDYDMSSQVMSINNGADGVGGGNVFVNNVLVAAGDIRSQIFYDYNNTGYYLDASSTGTSLNVAGSIVAAGNVTAYSDIRIKANVETIPSALDKLDQIRGVTYTRTDLDDKEQRYAGVIAQEIEAVLPEAVRDLGNIKAVDYNATIALLIQAVKELRDEVEALRK